MAAKTDVRKSPNLQNMRSSFSINENLFSLLSLAWTEKTQYMRGFISCTAMRKKKAFTGLQRMYFLQKLRGSHSLHISTYGRAITGYKPVRFLHELTKLISLIFSYQLITLGIGKKIRLPSFNSYNSTFDAATREACTMHT